MSLESWNKKLAQLSEIHKSGRAIWYSRDSFHGDYAKVKPKWHIFKDRWPSETKWSYTWEAICGYTYDFDEVMFERYPRVKLGKALPPKAERCTKCEAAQRKAANGKQ